MLGQDSLERRHITEIVYDFCKSQYIFTLQEKNGNRFFSLSKEGLSREGKFSFDPKVWR
jgi:hypothetical protein